MNPEVFSAGMKLGAVALIIGAVMSAVNGTAPVMGEQMRETIRPTLQSFRAHCALSRSELADRSMLAAVVTSSLAVLIERSFFAAIVAAGLWWARPMVKRLALQEHPLLAIGDSFTANLVVGLYLPVAMAQMLLGRVVTGLAMFLVILALSWPAGGAARGTGTWGPAWQH